jgi:hypothetical protein
MAGIFLTAKQMYDFKKSEEHTNAKLKRAGFKNFHTYPIVCGCPDPTCGGWHEVDLSRALPTNEECNEILKNHSQTRKNKKL